MSRPPGFKVTAIVSTYASAEFIRGCLDDLLAQTLYAQGGLEILVIDSGSPQNESEIIREYQQRHPHIRLERTVREPLYAAWNRAIELASGQYITNANTDDRHCPEALAVLATHLDNNPATSVVYADCFVTTLANETWQTNASATRFNWPSFSYEELQRRCILGPQPMWRKSLHAKWGLFDARFQVAGDYEFWLRIGRGERIDRYPTTLGLYYQNPKGLEHGSGATFDETVEIQKRYNGTAKAEVTASPLVVKPQTPAPMAQVQGASSKPMVSVIIPTFNRPDFLTRALGTLCEQTFKDFEVIVVNDHGDGLETLLQKFEHQLQITYIRHATNRDRAAARNTGIRASRGEYIAYLDDDDGYRPNHLAVLVEALQKQGGCVAYSKAAWLEEKKTSQGYEVVKLWPECDASFNRDRLMVLNYIPVLSVMHERSCLDEIGLFDEALGTHEDWDLFIRLANRYRFVHIPVVTADISVRNDGSSTTSSNRPDFLRTMKIVHERYRQLVASRPDILAAQDSMFVPKAPAVAPAKDIYDQAYQWGWEQPHLRELVYLCYKTPNFAENARRFFDSGEFKTELQSLALLGQGPGAGVKLLDVGCGNGVGSYALARSGYEVTGIDSSNGELAGVRAAEKLQGLDGVRFKAIWTSASTLGFPAESFNVVWLREVLHHIKDLDVFLKEVHRVLKPGGIICCFRDTVIWNEDQRKDLFDKHPFYHITKDEGAYYLREYQAAFQGAGFVCEKILNPLESLINTFPGPCNENARFDENVSMQRRTGYDLFSFFYRKPLQAESTQNASSLVDEALGRFEAFQANLTISVPR